MGVGRWIAVLATAVSLIASCDTATPSSDPEPRLSCGGEPTFDPADVLRAPDDLTTGSFRDSFSAFLKTPEARRAQLPQDLWIRVVATQKIVLLLRPIGGNNFAMARLGANGNGWVVDTWGGCRPRFQTGRQIAADWLMTERPTEASDLLHVVVSSERCGTLATPSASVPPPQFTYDSASISIRIWVPAKDPFGDKGCVGVEEQRTISLGEPIGRRAILNAGVYPAAEVGLGMASPDPGDASPGPDPR